MFFVINVHNGRHDQTLHSPRRDADIAIEVNKWQYSLRINQKLSTAQLSLAQLEERKTVTVQRAIVILRPAVRCKL
jgi:hypothetical protein